MQLAPCNPAGNDPSMQLYAEADSAYYA